MVRLSAGALIVVAAIAAQAPASAEPRSNAFGDPFGPVIGGMPKCPVPAGPLLSQDEARREAHWRAERGTSCYRSGRCRLPNAYLYDAELFPRLRQYLSQDPRFDGASIWVSVQRRWVTLHGCVRSAEQGAALEAAARQVDDVEAVIGEWMVGTEGKPPYELADAPAPQPAGILPR